MAHNIVFDLIARDRASDSFKQVGKSADGLRGKLKRAFSPAVMTAGFAAGGAAATAFGVASVKAFADADAQQRKLSNAFAKFPQLAGANAAALRKLNTELQKKTIYDDDAIAGAQSILASFGLTEKQIRTLTPLMLDFASRTGKDLPTAAQDLGKAIELGIGRSLKNVGIAFSDTGSQAGNFDTIVGDLRSKVGGFAENEGKTASGQLQIMQNQFGELEEKIGSKLLPTLLKLTDWLNNSGIPSIERFGNGWSEFWTKAGGGLYDFSHDVNTFMEPIVGAFEWWGEKAIWLTEKLNDLFNTARKIIELPQKIPDWILGSGPVQAPSHGAENIGRGFGTRASGGPVMSGSSYLVGEVGPELFVPSTSGTIVPNNALASGGNTFHITTIDPWAAARNVAFELKSLALLAG